MCDGTSVGRGKALTICTDCFSIEDVVRLMNVILLKYNITTSLHKAKGLPRIYVPTKEMNKFRNVLNGYIIPFFSYKITRLQK
jgi:hypothetical protein